MVQQFDPRGGIAGENTPIGHLVLTSLVSLKSTLEKINDPALRKRTLTVAHRE